MSFQDSQTPLIVRIAGLPAEVLRFFSSSLTDHISFLDSLVEDLSASRSDIVDRLYSAIPTAEPSLRHFLLDVKRDCFNGRSLSRYKNDRRWPCLLQMTPLVSEKIVALEERLEEWHSQFDEEYEQRRAGELRYLATFFDQVSFLRGIALASPVLVEQIERVRSRSLQELRKRDERLATSLLRYLSRTAAKLSPFSTLTRTGLARSCDGVLDSRLQLLEKPGNLSEVSTVRIRRYLVDQCVDMLLRHPPIRHRQRIALNDTLREVGPDTFSCVRAGCWREVEGEIQYSKPAFVKFRIPSSPFFARVREALAEGSLSQEELWRDLGSHLDISAASMESNLEQLVSLGILRVLPPWRSDELSLEDRLLEYLESLPEDPLLQPFILEFRRLLRLLDGFPEAPSPAQILIEGERIVHDLWNVLRPLARLGPEVRFHARVTDHFHEDIFLTSEVTCDGSIAQVSRQELRELVQSMDPLVRVSNFLSRRHDFLHTLGAWAAQEWPRQSTVDFLDFAHAAQPLFREYVKLEAALHKQPTFAVDQFNPLHLPLIERLAESRRRLVAALHGLITTRGDERALSPSAVDRLLESVPPPYADSRDFCLFVQPVSSLGGQWVLNTVFEGMGRLGSRFSHHMKEDAREQWISQVCPSVYRTGSGDYLETIDLLCPAGQTNNLHKPQTRRVIELPGESSSLPEELLLRFRDLRVELRGPDLAPRLTDGTGRLLQPVHLGGTIHRVMPTLFKFMALFGPGALELYTPRGAARDFKEVRIFDRHWIGPLVYARRCWKFNHRRLASRIAGLSKAKSFAMINQWRAEHEIPERVFLIEAMSEGEGRVNTKPQYIDFTSPLFESIFISALAIRVPCLYIQEALPALEELPSDHEGMHWAMELQIESTAFSAQPDIEQPPFIIPVKESTTGPWAI
jgi:hypothetical protein